MKTLESSKLPFYSCLGPFISLSQLSTSEMLSLNCRNSNKNFDNVFPLWLHNVLVQILYLFQSIDPMKSFL